MGAQELSEVMALQQAEVRAESCRFLVTAFTHPCIFVADEKHSVISFSDSSGICASPGINKDTSGAI